MESKRFCLILTMKILCVFFVVLLLCSCTDQARYTLDSVRMAAVIADLHIAEAAASQQEGSKKDSIIKVYYRQIYEIHKTNEDEFLQNLEMLKTDVEEMEKVYKIVNDSLDKRKSR